MVKAVTVGLDGFEWDLINKFRGEGKLPNFDKLIENGAYGEKVSTTPSVTMPAWKAHTTGKDPAKLGGYWWYNFDKEEKEYKLNDSRSFKGKELWDYLSDAGYKCGVINTPGTYPPKEINGFMVSGIQAFDHLDYTYPRELKDEIKKKYDYQVEFEHALSLDENTDKSIKEIKDIIRTRFKVARDVLREDDLDYLELTIFYTDNIEHFMWQFMDTDSKYSDVIEDVYRLVDSEIGKMLDILDESTYFFVVSDHGMQKLIGWFDLNKWLLDKGYIRINQGKEFSLQASLLKLLSFVGIDQNKAFQIGKGSLGRIISKILPFRKIADLYFRLETGEGKESRMDFAEKIIDWEKTDAFMLGDGMIVTNEIDGGRKKKLERDLMKIKDPRTGEKLLRDTKSKEELFEGPYIDYLPDLFLIPSPGYFFTSSINLKNQGYWDYEPRNGLSGEHKSEGVIIVGGPEVEQGKDIGKMKIYDFVPTVLHTFGEPVPRDLTGEVKKEIFEKGSDPRERKIKHQTDEKTRIKKKVRKMEV